MTGPAKTIQVPTIVRLLAPLLIPINKQVDDGGAVEPGQPAGAGFLKGFPGMQKKTTRGQFYLSLISRSDAEQSLDGQPAKRRGPKPDSKPAQTRRQELNRQAQRYLIRVVNVRLHTNAKQYTPRTQGAIHQSSGD